jgi:flavin-dependent dehydrogenase
MKKYSGCFDEADGRASDPFYFFNRYGRDTIARSRSVLLSGFDVMMHDHAIEKGAEIREETRGKEMLMEAARVVEVRAVTREGKEFELRAHMTLDCSGKRPSARTNAPGGWGTPT